MLSALFNRRKFITVFTRRVHVRLQHVAGHEERCVTCKDVGSPFWRQPVPVYVYVSTVLYTPIYIYAR